MASILRSTVAHVKQIRSVRILTEFLYISEEVLNQSRERTQAPTQTASNVRRLYFQLMVRRSTPPLIIASPANVVV